MPRASIRKLAGKQFEYLQMHLQMHLQASQLPTAELMALDSLALDTD